MPLLLPVTRRCGAVALTLGAALLVQACQNPLEPFERQPASAATLEGELRAFRSVLDGKPRMLTLRQPDAVQLAYDAESGHLYKAWYGDVHFSGAVYDTRHGPQPASQGAVYFTQDQVRWNVPNARVRYAGHSFYGEKTALHYRVRGEGWTGEIREIPGTRREGDALELTREFVVSGLPAEVELSLEQLTLPAERELDGVGRWHGERGLLLGNGVTRLTLRFDDARPIPDPQAREPDQHPGQALIENSDCVACHNPEVQTVGPSYQAIARRYEQDVETVKQLTNRIIEGSSGHWGQAAMTPHPDLSRREAAQLLDYIFTLAPEEESGGAEEGERVAQLESLMPGDRSEVAGVHPAFDLRQARPDDFEPKVGGIDTMPDGRLVITTWDPEGSVYLVSHYTAEPEDIQVKRIARGLAEPLGLKVVDGEIYVMQKQELTRLVDDNGDEVIDHYQTVANDWSVTDNFHEFAFGLEYENGHFLGTLATAILPGGASADPQAPDRGKVVKIRKSDGAVEFIAQGLRTPNGIGFGIDNQLFIADNQGDWLPASKIVELTPGAWFGSRSVDFEGTAGLEETLPVVWLPQDEIGNSPSEPVPLNVGPYQNQMIHGEVTHGGIKRVYAERVNGRLQGAVFRFTQGLEAGVNRLAWAPDGSLMVGGVGSAGNWSHADKKHYGLQRLVYNGDTAFEMLSVSARADGFVIEFTEAIAEDETLSADNFDIQQWYYQPTAEYGGPKKNVTELPVEGFSLSDDRKTVKFKLGGLKPDHVVYFRIKRPFVSASDTSLWSTEAWYTLNALPEGRPVRLDDGGPRHNRLTGEEQAEGCCSTASRSRDCATTTPSP